MYALNGLRNWWDRSLLHRLLISSIVIVAFFLLMQGFLAFQVGQSSIRSEVDQRNGELAALIAKDTRKQLDTIWKDMVLFTHQAQENDAPLSHHARAMLDLRRTLPLTYSALYLYDGNGQQLVHLDDPLEELFSLQDVATIVNREPITPSLYIQTAYAEALLSAQARPVLLGTHLKLPEQVPVLYMAAAIVPAAQRADRKVIVAEIDLRDLWRRMDDIRIGHTGRAFVVASDGIIIAHPERKYIGRMMPAALKAALEGYEGQTEYVDSVSGKTMLAAFSPIGGESGWAIVVEQERDEIFAPIRLQNAFTVAILLIAIAMSVLVNSLVAKGITRPIQHLAATTRVIAETGDLSRNVTVESGDEVGQLTHHFNQMIANLRLAEVQIRQLNETLERRVSERTAQLESANAELQAFAYVVSHDLKAPLRGIRQLADWLSSDYADRLDDEGVEMLHQVTSRADRLQELIDGILEYSRIGQAPAVEKQIDLGALVRDIIEMLSPPAHIRITVEDELPVVMGDPALLQQVFQNLLGNAIKFMDKPHGSIQLRCSESAAQWQFSIADNGPGIAAADRERIFRMFQAGAPRARGESSGIGLAVVKKIVERWGGTVWVESRPGEGSTFFFTRPREFRGPRRE